MCKVFIASGINSSNRNKSIELILAMSDIIGETMKDGIGYAAVNEMGDLFGERWHKSEEAFQERIESTLKNDALSIASSYQGALTPIGEPVKYNSFGPLDFDRITAITLHGRYATSSKDFKNTHPFVLNDTSLIHNGVIRNAHRFELKQSTCDSEAILNLYDKHKVKRFPSNIQSVSNQLEGYFACGVFTRTESGQRVLDIFKDETANLFAAFIKELGIMVFTTNIKDLNDACEITDLTIEHSFKVNAGHLMRIDPITGTVLHTETFNCQPVYQKQKPSVFNQNHVRMMYDDRILEDEAIDLSKVLGT